MTIFDVLTLIGGLCLFLFGMNVMGNALERSAGSKLEIMLGKLTSNKFLGLLTGLGVTAVIQSSSATTVMVVGFVNSGLMSLTQAIHVIMGANIGTTVTAWILSLGGISGDSLFLRLLKPTSFTPILALAGIILYMFAKSNRKKDIGTIFLGFAVLMFGMNAMTDAVSGLADVPAFQEMFLMFKNPILGVLVGALLTAVIQSSSASVGILQALAVTGAVSYGAVIPIIMGQNIGTCITAIISSFGTNKNAKRAALVHLSFNVIGTVVWLTTFAIVDAALAPTLFDEAASLAGIATAHSLFNIACTLLLLPASKLLEKLAYKLVPESKVEEKVVELDERLLATPAIALERCHSLLLDMAKKATDALINSLDSVKNYNQNMAQTIREYEGLTDHYEDIIGSYLVKINTYSLNDDEGAMATMMLKSIGDFERISDYAVGIIKSAEELKDKNIIFSTNAQAELDRLFDATKEIVLLSYQAFANDDTDIATNIGPLEKIITRMKAILRTNHIERLRYGDCSIEAGFVWNDLLTSVKRAADCCENIAGCVIDVKERKMNIHELSKTARNESEAYEEKYNEYSNKYLSTI